MTATEAREKIISEFINGYYEWLEDVKAVEGKEWREIFNSEYFKKYPMTPADGDNVASVKDNQKWLVWYHRNIFNGRWLKDWEKEGFEKQTIWALRAEGFLFVSEYSNWNARSTGHTAFYFISQATAKEIYKGMKVGM